MLKLWNVIANPASSWITTKSPQICPTSELSPCIQRLLCTNVTGYNATLWGLHLRTCHKNLALHMSWKLRAFLFLFYCVFWVTQFASWLGFGAARLKFVGECSCRQLRTLAEPLPVSCSSSPTPRSDCQTGRLWQVWICQVLWKCDHSPWVLSPLANTNCCIAPLLFPSHCNAFPTLQSDKRSQFFPPPAALSNVSSDVGWHSPRVSPTREVQHVCFPIFFRPTCHDVFWQVYAT